MAHTNGARSVLLTFDWPTFSLFSPLPLVSFCSGNRTTNLHFFFRHPCWCAFKNVLCRSTREDPTTVNTLPFYLTKAAWRETCTTCLYVTYTRTFHLLALAFIVRHFWWRHRQQTTSQTSKHRLTTGWKDRWSKSTVFGCFLGRLIDWLCRTIFLFTGARHRHQFFGNVVDEMRVYLQTIYFEITSAMNYKKSDTRI